jgi:predicted RNA-binding Zn-ribbon protein involved in translation (DUF1610 family)
MQSQEKFSLLRSILRTLGLSAEAVDDIIDRIVDFLSEKDEKPHDQVEYPYLVRGDFLSPAEQSFYLVLKSVVSDWALICPKVALGDLFYAKSKDPSRYRTFTNRIDRKHVDFLLCDPKTVQPIVGIELDDKSHQRNDRRARDEFVEMVFVAAKLPLVRVPVRQSYSASELSSLLRQHIGSHKVETTSQPVITEKTSAPPRCPKCGSEMVLRTAKSGSNQGGQFWGCSDYPRCRGILKYKAQATSS